MKPWEKIYRYEFWPYWLFYLHTIPYVLYLAFKAKSLSFFTNVNPGIYLSGIVGESKMEILNKLPIEYVPKTIFINATNTESETIQKILQNFHFPIIIKPDIGERGDGVEKINNVDELKFILNKYQNNFIVQEFLDHELEFGIMYYRIPGTNEYGVTSIVQKGFLEVIGDGTTSIKDLLLKNERAVLVWNYLEQHLKDSWHSIPKINEKILVQPIGNHCKGTAFYNANHLINDEVADLFHKIVRNFDGFNYGRFDVKATSIKDLYTGENLKIMELNGITSEPGHIYDPKYRLWRACIDVHQHFQLVYRISKANKKLGIFPAKWSEFYNLMKNYYSA